MGLFDALTNAVSGLQSQAYAMQNISGNIANSQTISYKGLNTNFQDLIPDSNSVASQQVGSGVYASSLATVTVQGAIQAAQSGTNIAVNGDGFFTVQNPTSFTGTTPNFDGVVSYTRRGDFELNANGYLVNGAGYYLEGIPIDQTTGAPIGNVPAPLQFNNNLLPASPTTQVNYGINLPATPSTPSFNSAVPNSELLNLAGFTQNPTLTAGANTNAVMTGTSALGTIDASGGAITFKINGQTVTLAINGGTASDGHYTPADLVSAINTQVGASAKVNATLNGAGDMVLTSTNTPGSGDTITVDTFSSGDATQLGFAVAAPTANGANGLPATGQVIGTDAPNFINELIDGGSATVYDAAGTPANLQLRWTKIDSVAAGGSNTWELFYQTDANATGNQVAWQNAGTDFTFNSAGQLVGGSASIALNNVTIGSTNLGNLTLLTPVGSITQFANTSGQPTINNVQANGFPAGQLQSVSVGSNGLISGIFSNGRNVNLAEIPLVHFNAEDNLQSLTGGAYQATTDLGQAIAGASGKVVGQSLESSNVDIATEFTKLIVTQQAYSANTKVITTANQMSQDLLNVIR